MQGSPHPRGSDIHPALPHLLSSQGCTDFPLCLALLFLHFFPVTSQPVHGQISTSVISCRGLLRFLSVNVFKRFHEVMGFRLLPAAAFGRGVAGRVS